MSSSSQTEPNSLDWPTALKVRQGAPTHLASITVWYDFSWHGLFGNQRTQFPHGQALAKFVVTNTPPGADPILLLTRRTDRAEGPLKAGNAWVVVVNIDNYLTHAKADFVASYFINVSGINPLAIAQYDWSLVPTDRIRDALDGRLDPALLADWLAADHSRLGMLVDALRVESSTEQTGQRSDVGDQDVAVSLARLLTDDMWHALEAAGMEIPLALAYRRVWRERRSAVAVFEEHIEASVWNEARWHSYFEANTWIFGLALRYQFLATLDSKPMIGGKDFTGRGGQEGDFLLAAGAARRFTALVEIKRPDSELVRAAIYRNRVHELGHHLVGGVTQVQQQCWRWASEGSETSDNRELLLDLNAHAHEPVGILVIGNTKSLATGPMMRTFESFRRKLTSPEVIAFDELLVRAQNIVELHLDPSDCHQGEE